MKENIINDHDNLVTTLPDLAKQWDYDANKDLKNKYGKDISTPDKVKANSSCRVGWICPVCGYKWQAPVSNRARGAGCPCCAGKVPACGTDLATTHPELALEWDYIANAGLKTKKGIDISTPDKVRAGSDQKVGWVCSICGHKWKSTVKDRSHGHGCPSCSMQVVVQGKDLTATHPELAKQWDYEANRELKNGHGRDISTPDKVSAGSTMKVGWVCPVCDYRWQAMVKDRTRGYGCPCCSGLVVAPCKDLLSMFPNIAAQWDYEANKDLKDGHGRDISTPDKISYGSSLNVAWHCDVCNQSWVTAVNCRTIGGNGCPHCSGHYPIPNKTDLKTVKPSLAREWHPFKNVDLIDRHGRDISTPDKISVHSHQRVWWKCSICGYEWDATVCDRIIGLRDCPVALQTIKA